MYDRCIRSIVKKTSWEFPALRSLEFLTVFPAESVLEFNVSLSDIKIDVLGSLLDENFQILTPLNYVK